MKENNKKKVDYKLLFIIIYIIITVGVVLIIWIPGKMLNGKKYSGFKYEDVDEQKKGINLYKDTVKYMLSEGNLDMLYNHLDENFKSSNGITKDNFKEVLEKNCSISKEISIIGSEVYIQGDNIYVYRYKYKSKGFVMYVNVIETKPFEYTLSFEQYSVPVVEGTENKKNNVIDNVEYSVNIESITQNGITYGVTINNKGQDTVEYNFSNITDVYVILSDGRYSNLGGAIISSDDDVLTPNGSLRKSFFFPVKGADQSKITKMRFNNVKKDNKITSIEFEVKK